VWTQESVQPGRARLAPDYLRLRRMDSPSVTASTPSRMASRPNGSGPPPVRGRVVGIWAGAGPALSGIGVAATEVLAFGVSPVVAPVGAAALIAGALPACALAIWVTGVAAATAAGAAGATVAVAVAGATAVAVKVAATTAVAVAGASVGTVVGVGVAVERRGWLPPPPDGTAVAVAAASAVLVRAAGTAVARPTVHPLEPTVLVSRVTAPLRAMARPLTVAFVVKVTLVSAMMVPRNVVVVPSVAELPTCQNTLHGEPGLIMRTTELLAVVSVLPILKMKTALLLP
jgi:hypothetical protein